jgi:hypothetical protein
VHDAENQIAGTCFARRRYLFEQLTTSKTDYGEI